MFKEDDYCLFSLFFSFFFFLLAFCWPRGLGRMGKKFFYHFFYNFFQSFSPFFVFLFFPEPFSHVNFQFWLTYDKQIFYVIGFRFKQIFFFQGFYSRGVFICWPSHPTYRHKGESGRDESHIKYFFYTLSLPFSTTLSTSFACFFFISGFLLLPWKI